MSIHYSCLLEIYFETRLNILRPSFTSHNQPKSENNFCTGNIMLQYILQKKKKLCCRDFHIFYNAYYDSKFQGPY